MSYIEIDNKMWDIELHMMKKIGCDAAQSAMYPLKWYIKTGRATTTFLHWLLEQKPFVVARILQKEGSHDDIITMLKTRAGVM